MGQATTAPDSQAQSFARVQAKLASCSKVVGEAFFPVMVEALADALSVRWVLLCTLHPVVPDRVCTVAVWDNGPGDNFEYDLVDTPCADILAQGACCFPDRITALFPRDAMLKEMGATSYIGTPLRSASGATLGLLAALDEKPMPMPEQASEIIELFSGRAAAELERLAAASLNERLGRIVEDSVSEVYIFDGETYLFELVNRGARDNLGYSMDELRQLTPWDLKPDYSAEEFRRFVAPLVSGETASLKFETVHRRKDATLYDVAVQLQFFGGVDNVFYASITDITDQKRAEQARAHLAAIVASSNEAIISTTLDGRVTSWNAGAEKIYGFPADEMIGKSIRRLIPADRHDEEDEILARTSRGEPISNYETVRQCKDGRSVDVSVNVSPIYGAQGKIIGASKIAHDISERKRAEAREKLLAGEINHRAKNLLALVQVIARQTAASDAETFLQRFDERIHALAASHDVLLQSGWKDIPLDDLVRSQLVHLQGADGHRIQLSGPALEITAAAAQAIGMALHELATNAAKYGALSTDAGEVLIEWTCEADASGAGRFELVWKERGGPVVAAPARRGFGSTVISRILKLTLEGEVDLDFQPEGLVCRLRCDAGRVLDRRSAASDSRKSEQVVNGSGNDRARRVLLVEDEVLIGIDVAEMLKEAGFEILGPAATVAQALELLEDQDCDAGVLDINLGDETSELVAERLARDGKPFLTVSSYGVAGRPAAFRASPHLDKPLRPELLVGSLHDLLGAAA